MLQTPAMAAGHAHFRQVFPFSSSRCRSLGEPTCPRTTAGLGLGCVKTHTCCDAVEWCSQGSDVHHLSREVRLSALTERRCRNLDNSEILALLARASRITFHATMCHVAR
jgi:hypothetical protein